MNMDFVVNSFIIPFVRLIVIGHKAVGTRELYARGIADGISNSLETIFGLREIYDLFYGPDPSLTRWEVASQVRDFIVELFYKIDRNTEKDVISDNFSDIFYDLEWREVDGEKVMYLFIK